MLDAEDESDRRFTMLKRLFFLAQYMRDNANVLEQSIKDEGLKAEDEVEDDTDASKDNNDGSESEYDGEEESD